MKKPTSRKRKIKTPPIILWRASFLVSRAYRRHPTFSEQDDEASSNPWFATYQQIVNRYVKAVKTGKGNKELAASLNQNDLDQVHFMSRWVQRRCYYSPKQWIGKVDVDFYTAKLSYQPQKLVQSESFEIRHPIGPSKRNELILDIKNCAEDASYKRDIDLPRLVAVVRSDRLTMDGLRFNKVLLRFVRNTEGWGGGEYEAVTILERQDEV